MYILKDISKTYDAREVLSQVSIEIPENRMISIMGKSGSGKSTLLGILAGLVKPESGHIEFAGKNLIHMNEEELAEFRLKDIGYIFQDFKLISSLTVYDNILLGVFPRKDMSKDTKNQLIHEVAEQVELGGKLNQKVDVLSGGEKQRVATARTLVKKPGLILADEPTGNLDSKTANTIMNLFDELHQNLSTTFLIVTHDKDIASRTQQTYFLKDGVLHENE